MNIKNNTKRKYLLYLLIAGIFLLPIFIQNNKDNWKNNLRGSGSWELLPFVIDDSGGGDYIWAEAVMFPWCSGSGTSVDPYIIENIVIDGLGGSLKCITIRSSSVYFIIRDSIFYNGRTGIDLYGVSNGIIINNTCYSNSNYGIALGSDSLITENIIYSNGYGINVYGTGNTISNNTMNNDGIRLNINSDYNTISNNVMNDNEIYLSGASNNLITGNRINRGLIYLSSAGIDYGCYNNELTGNIINNGGVNIYGYTVIEVASHYIDTTNLVNGKPLYYYTNEVGLGNSDFGNAGQIILVNCRHSLISNLGISNTSCLPTDDFTPGILLYYSTNNIISDVNILFCGIGIELKYSNDNTIENNTVCNNNREGIRTTYSGNNIISRNIAENNRLYGIYLADDSNNNIVLGNIVNNVQWYDGIYLYGDNNNISGNIVNDNEGTGIRCRGDNNTISGNTANNNKDGIIAGSNNTIIKNMVNSNSRTGIGIDSNNIVLDNIIHENVYTGISTWYSENNFIRNNSIEFSNRGIRLVSDSNNNVILENILKNNNYGIRFDSGYIPPQPPYPFDNLIYNNIFIGNNINAEDQGGINQWDNGTMGNYWDDYIGSDANDDGIGDTPYTKYGVQDNYPSWWDAPVLSIISPVSNSIFGSNAPDFEISIDEGISDTTWYTLDEGLTNITIIETTGIINQSIWSDLPDGSITIRFYVNDTKGYERYNSIIFIKDTTPPIWVQIPTDQNVEYGNSLSYDLNATDLYGISQWVLNDTTYFSIDDNNGLIYNTTSLSVGIYLLEVSVKDMCDNERINSFKIIVQDTIDPIWISLPIDQVIEYGESLSYDISASDISGISQYWINNTIYFNIDENGVITNRTILIAGTYWLEVRAYDPYGHYCTAIFKVDVQAIDIPEPEPEPDDIIGIDLIPLIVITSLATIIPLIIITRRRKK